MHESVDVMVYVIVPTEGELLSLPCNGLLTLSGAPQGSQRRSLNPNDSLSVAMFYIVSTRMKGVENTQDMRSGLLVGLFYLTFPVFLSSRAFVFTLFFMR